MCNIIQCHLFRGQGAVPDFTKGVKLFIAATLFLKDPWVIPWISTGGASSNGWIAQASFSKWAT